MKKTYSFYVHILTNPRKSTLYIGLTNNLLRRTVEHYLNRGRKETFASRYYYYNVIWFEWHQYIYNAIDREKQIKNFTRGEKEALITKINPNWVFYNQEICGSWPPTLELINSVRNSTEEDEIPDL